MILAPFWEAQGLQKSAALLAAPGVLNPTARNAFITCCFGLTLGGAKPAKIQAETSACWGHVGTFFGLGRLFVVLGWFLHASCTF